MTGRVERTLLAATPFAAMVVVGLGLGWGAPDAVSAAVVVAAPRSGAGTGLAWQIVAVEDARGLRTPIAHASITVIARDAGHEARWSGTTNDDGVAEATLDVASDTPDVEVRMGETVLARGRAAPPALPRVTAERVGPWMPFARRTGPIAIDVAALGGRVAPGFPATLGVHTTDAATRAPVAHVDVWITGDTVNSATSGRTDSEGWAVLNTTPVGLALTLGLEARQSQDSPLQPQVGPKSNWSGGLYASPGGAQIATRARWSPAESPALEVTAPTSRRTAYVEVDDARGRAWAAALDLEASRDGTSHAPMHVPPLTPGLYWAIAASDPGGAEWLGPGTTARPFFVAASDEAALAAEGGREGCAVRRDVREASDALWPCLALATPSPAARWVALDGAVQRRAAQRTKRARGLGLALGAIAVAAVLEGIVVIRAGARRGRLGAVLLATAVALLGFALLAAFLMRTA